jgi:hypothetical protein
LDGTRGGDVRAARVVAEWPDKAVAPGPGYAVVECPHCAMFCVVEVGGVARTACIGCLRPLGESPLVRIDLAERTDDPRGDDRPAFVSSWSRITHDLGSCLVFPGESA